MRSIVLEFCSRLALPPMMTEQCARNFSGRLVAMNIGNRKGKASFVLFAFTILSFRLLMYFWYIKAPSQHFISDTVRRCILGDGTRLFGLMAVYVIICKLRRTSVIGQGEDRGTVRDH